ncbi:hypothetical protein C8Q70DRAFT_1059845 [Cubamyces menziesii]|nr:hypothetical protein C8Q70DRAFT_1059845 [Cubamyces menziesii]
MSQFVTLTSHEFFLLASRELLLLASRELLLLASLELLLLLYKFLLLASHELLLLASHHLKDSRFALAVHLLLPFTSCSRLSFPMCPCVPLPACTHLLLHARLLPPLMLFTLPLLALLFFTLSAFSSLACPPRRSSRFDTLAHLDVVVV